MTLTTAALAAERDNLDARLAEMEATVETLAAAGNAVQETSEQWRDRAEAAEAKLAEVEADRNSMNECWQNAVISARQATSRAEAAEAKRNDSERVSARLTLELEAAEARIAQFEAALSGGVLTKTDSQELLSRLGSAEAEADRMRAELADARKVAWGFRSYATHDNDCKVNKPPHFDPTKCSCGLSALRKKSDEWEPLAKGDQA